MKVSTCGHYSGKNTTQGFSPLLQAMYGQDEASCDSLILFHWHTEQAKYTSSSLPWCKSSLDMPLLLDLKAVLSFQICLHFSINFYLDIEFDTHTLPPTWKGSLVMQAGYDHASDSQSNVTDIYH